MQVKEITLFSARRSQGSNQSHCHGRRNTMASMMCYTEVIDGMKTKEFRSELARAGFPG